MSVLRYNNKNRLKWSAWTFTYLCAFVPPLVDSYLIQTRIEWYTWACLAIMGCFLVHYLIMLVIPGDMDGGIATLFLASSVALTAFTTYGTYEAYYDQRQGGAMISAADVTRGRMSYFTTLIGGLLAIISMFIQWQMDRHATD
ncbi:hypothetical protein BGX29_001427 [Mortierella sp. GBA35]|nr:hypothetical protein BGX23_000244 [Mortierella sp. AD031]KAF9086382.1 hypothetical protein BGX29_001427 [Mortierella sp. GBA35]KAG0207145.1 hypothetical protein BGX33_007010 [Mortierella sp. NVP41]